MDLKTSMLAAVIGALCGALASYTALAGRIDNLAAEIALRPPLVVVDMGKLALDSVSPNATQTEINAYFTGLQKSILKLQAAGYVVLAKEHVVTAPVDIYLSKGDIE